RGRYGDSLKQVAQLLKADVGVEVAFTDVGGWDHHAAEGGVQGQLAARLREFGQALAAFRRDLGDRMQDVVLVTMTEFGRTVRENGNRGTDHGHASFALVLGGDVRGGRVHGRWPGLAPDKLYEGRDLAITTDFRDVLGEVLARHLGARDLSRVFPGYAVSSTRFPGGMRAVSLPPVNFQALPIRLSSTTLKSRGSPRAASASAMSHCTRRCGSERCKPSATWRAMAERSTSCQRISARLTRERSSRPSMSSDILRVPATIRRRESVAAGGSWSG